MGAQATFKATELPSKAPTTTTHPDHCDLTAEDSREAVGIIIFKPGPHPASAATIMDENNNLAQKGQPNTLHCNSQLLYQAYTQSPARNAKAPYIDSHKSADPTTRVIRQDPVIHTSVQITITNKLFQKDQTGRCNKQGIAMAITIFTKTQRAT